MPITWYITGSSRGLGKALVQYALDSGDRVAATARNIDALAGFSAKYPADQFLALELDVTNYDAARRSATVAFKHFGSIHLVVNNAGYADTGSVEDTSIESFRAQVETNFFGVVNSCKAFVPLLREQGFGHILQVSSLGGRLGSPGLSAYQSAKWAVNGFSTCLAAEVASLGLRVTVLEPGAMNTDWAGTSMKIPPVSEPYRETVGQFAAMLKSGHGSTVTDINKVGHIVRTLYESTDAPVRILVGLDALQYAPSISRAQAESDEKWKGLSASCAT